MQKTTANRSDLRDKIVLVTGGAQGLGAAICRNLAQAGANVQVADVQGEKAEKLVTELRGAGGRAQMVNLDVSQPAEVERAVAGVMSAFGRIDVVVNNAGIDKTVSIEELGVDEWQKILAVNLTGPFLVAKRVLPLMRELGSGHIVNIVSTAAKRAWPNAAAYHASKWGLLGFSHALHSEARPHGIKVTAVICGGMRTPFLLERFPDLDPNNLQDPADVAETIRYVLCAPVGTVISEIMALPMRETSWP